MMAGRNLHELGLMNGTLLRLLDEVDGGGSDEDDDGRRCSSATDGARSSASRRRGRPACSSPTPARSIAARGSSCRSRSSSRTRPRAARFLRREMLYTAITRATLATVIVGTREMVARAARTPTSGAATAGWRERLAQAG